MEGMDPRIAGYSPPPQAAASVKVEWPVAYFNAVMACWMGTGPNYHQKLAGAPTHRGPTAESERKDLTTEPRDNPVGTPQGRPATPAEMSGILKAVLPSEWQPRGAAAPDDLPHGPDQ